MANDLDRREQELDERMLAMNEQEAKLSEEAKRLEEQEKVLSEAKRQYDNYRDNIRKQAEYFSSMPPRDAVERLQKLEDLLIVDILREIDKRAEETGTQSIVPYYLSLMDAERAASVQRKMTKVFEFEEL
jgi:flagellar protein FlbB